MRCARDLLMAFIVALECNICWARPMSDVGSSQPARPRVGPPRCLQWVPDCVKRWVSRECAESFSPFSSFDCDCRCCSFPIQRNRDKRSTRKFAIGVFTQSGSKTEVASLKWEVRSTLRSGHRRAAPARPFRAMSRHRSKQRYLSGSLAAVGEAAVAIECETEMRS
jgi:hypothetical protein